MVCQMVRAKRFFTMAISIRASGKMAYQNANKYEGNHVAGVKQGMGTYTYATGERYEGAYLNGKMHGEGTFFYKDGEKYVGHFADDAIQGMGSYLDAADSTLAEGRWEAGKLVEPKPEAAEDEEQL
jgi:hypothetical protein